jgi:adenylate kinase family enzyme
MPAVHNQGDRLLVQYLLGSLPAEETERLDELSVTDDDFATRLSVAENDLVDAYVRGELAADTADRFRTIYAATPRRREKVRFAESLLSYQKREASAAISVHSEAEQKSTRRCWRFFTLPSLMPQWGLAAMAIILLVATGYLGLANRRLRDQLSRAGTERLSLEQREQQLTRQLEKKLSENAGGSVAASNLPKPLDRLKIAAFMLTPAIRGGGQLLSVSTSSDTDLVVLKMELEVGDFPKYRVELEDAATRQVLWTSEGLEAFSDGDRKAVSFAFPSALLKRQIYLVQLGGIRANGTSKLISAYPFRFVVK